MTRSRSVMIPGLVVASALVLAADSEPQCTPQYPAACLLDDLVAYRRRPLYVPHDKPLIIPDMSKEQPQNRP
jgi:hypothetical protein